MKNTWSLKLEAFKETFEPTVHPLMRHSRPSVVPRFSSSSETGEMPSLKITPKCWQIVGPRLWILPSYIATLIPILSSVRTIIHVTKHLMATRCFPSFRSTQCYVQVDKCVAEGHAVSRGGILCLHHQKWGYRLSASSALNVWGFLSFV